MLQIFKDRIERFPIEQYTYISIFLWAMAIVCMLLGFSDDLSDVGKYGVGLFLILIWMNSYNAKAYRIRAQHAYMNYLDHFPCGELKNLIDNPKMDKISRTFAKVLFKSREGCACQRSLPERNGQNECPYRKD
ncbi:hypothetical protein ACI2KR_31000 [Pseudomonas luteola]